MNRRQFIAAAAGGAIFTGVAGVFAAKLQRIIPLPSGRGISAALSICHCRGAL
jgi:hypothetical protein